MHTRTHGILLPLMVMIALSIAGCDLFGDDDSGVDCEETLDLDDLDALSQCVEIPGARLNEGNPPPPSNTPNAPVVGRLVGDVTASNGSTLVLPFTYASTAAFAGVYLELGDADYYFDVPRSATFDDNGQVTLPITLPPSLEGGGEFCTSYCIYDAEDRVSNVVTTCVDVLALGSGALQISLSWNTDDTDLDLWVTDPSGTLIYFGNRTSPTGGQLDRDDTDGFGPENIFWLDDTAPDGAYRVEVDYYGGSAVTNYVVTVNAPRTSRRFEGTLRRANDRDLVTVVTKRGDQLQFSSGSADQTAAAPMAGKRPAKAKR